MISQKRLHQILYYHPESGDFVWNEKTTSCVVVGRLAGTKNVLGYMQIRVYPRIYLSHRLAWFYVYGEWPKRIDHINRDKADNRIVNLRLATFAQNKQNVKAPRTNTSGVKGIRWYARYSKFHVQLRANGQRYHIGYFARLEDAQAACDAARRTLHGEFACA
jgi:hypothetical protein